MQIEDSLIQSSLPTEILNIAPQKLTNFPSESKITSKRDLLRSVDKKQIQEMMDKVRSQINKNKKKYEKLINLNPYFTIKLYQPNNQFTAEQDNQLSIKILMQQIDLLLDEDNYLQKQLKKCQLKRMQSDYVDPTQREEIKHHFTYLRKIWVEASKVQSKNDIQKIEQLNKRVVLIKNSVLQLSQHERNCYNIAQKASYTQVDQVIKQAVEKTQQFMALKQKYQNSRMRLEQIQGRVSILCIKHKNELIEKDKDIAKLIRQNDDLRRQNKQLKEKMIVNDKKELKLLQKIARMEQQIRQTSKMQTISSQPNILNPPNSNSNFADIKFRKIQVPQHIMIDHHPENLIKRLSNHQKQVSSSNILENQQFTGRLSLPLHNIEERLQSHHIETHSNRFNILADNKSLDGKKGRFIRMRSPGNARLMKQQDEGQNYQKLNITQSSSTNSNSLSQK